MIIQKQLIRFVIVGILNTLFGYSLYALFIYLGLYYPGAIFFATCFGVFFNFKTMGKFVFVYEHRASFFKFIAAYVLIYLFNMLLIYIGHRVLSNLYLAGFIALAPVALLSFILNKWFVFKKSSSQSIQCSGFY